MTTDRYRLAWLSARRRADCRTTTAQLEAAKNTTERVWAEYDLMKARAERAEAELKRAHALGGQRTCTYSGPHPCHLQGDGRAMYHCPGILAPVDRS